MAQTCQHSSLTPATCACTLAPAAEDPREVSNEVERLKKEKMAAYQQIERYKKWVTHCILFALFALTVAVIMIIWRFTEPARR